ncbi:hypothetical protein IAR55_004511 [Kwoniella newhampshirensis]|uniref:ATP-dependent DNA helicase PIF1 n=1 Tax=Kwoniella newhampshirensis TaxID=1651941 RepID=A0AAW0YJW9_9TREE
MPSLISARPSTSTSGMTQPKRTMSRVTSFKREWGDDEEDSTSLKDNSGEIAWSPSPDRIKRKGNLPPPPPAPQQPNLASSSSRSTISAGGIGDTPAERRRKAILAAMSQNTDLPSASTSASASSSKKQALPSLSSANNSSSITRATQTISSAQRTQTPPTPQELPSLPASSSLLKRALPWEEEHAASKRAMAKTNSTGNTKTVTSTGPSLNIKQKVALSAEQQKVLQLVVAEGKNIFFTGSAGTGKSVLLREIIKNLRRKFATAPDAVAVTASTGIAACNIGGVTLHSFGGVGLAIDKPDILLGKLRKNRKAAARWQRTKVLIIDEVSMVEGDMFDKFCRLGQMIRKNQKPFGGIQIIVTGDFFQLPPVTKGGASPKFCFEAEMWDETINMSVNLTRVFRQKDQRFVDMLNEMRFGRLSPQSIAAFKQLARNIEYTDGIEPTELFPRREDVDRANNTRLTQINREGYSYQSTDGGAITDPTQREKLLSNFMAPAWLELKENAQVMLIKNMDETLVNGSMGKVLGFAHRALFFQDTSGRWDPFADLEGLDEEERYKKNKMREIVLAKMSAGGAKPYPVVRFNVPGGGFRDILIEPDQFKAELPNGEIQASRSQLPLILAWAMSIHKSQGQTLDRVKVDLGKVFEKGQAYVALSRATSLDGLQVTGFNAEKVMAHRKVAIWSNTLKDLNV